MEIELWINEKGAFNEYFVFGNCIDLEYYVVHFVTNKLHGVANILKTQLKRNTDGSVCN